MLTAIVILDYVKHHKHVRIMLLNNFLPHEYSLLSCGISAVLKLNQLYVYRHL